MKIIFPKFGKDFCPKSSKLKLKGKIKKQKPNYNETT